MEHQQKLKLTCLELANAKQTFNDEGMMINLNTDETIAAATKFYEFLTVDKKDN